MGIVLLGVVTGCSSPPDVAETAIIETTAAPQPTASATVPPTAASTPTQLPLPTLLPTLTLPPTPTSPPSATPAPSSTPTPTRTPTPTPTIDLTAECREYLAPYAAELHPHILKGTSLIGAVFGIVQGTETLSSETWELLTLRQTLAAKAVPSCVDGVHHLFVEALESATLALDFFQSGDTGRAQMFAGQGTDRLTEFLKEISDP